MFLSEKYSENYYFSLGRNAMAVALRVLNIKKGDEILTPAWDCDGALQPFREIDCNLIFYKINSLTFDVDIEHIKSLITKDTKLLHVINYFGIPQNWDLILKIKEEYALNILEDNAYSLFSEYKNMPIGSFGDFAIFSIRKCLPVPDGGMLVNNSDLTIEIKDIDSRFLYSIDISKAKQLLIQTIKKYIVFTIWFNKLKPKRSNKIYPFPIYSDNTDYFPVGERSHEGNEFNYRKERPISTYSGLMLRFYTTRILKKRRNGYIRKYRSIVRNLLNIESVKVLHSDIDNGIMPYCAFIIVENRDKLFLYLSSKNYPVMVWPSLPQKVLDNLDTYPEVKYLGQKLIQINLKPYLSEYYYLSMVSDIKRYLKSEIL